MKCVKQAGLNYLIPLAARTVHVEQSILRLYSEYLQTLQQTNLLISPRIRSFKIPQYYVSHRKATTHDLQSRPTLYYEQS